MDILDFHDYQKAFKEIEKLKMSLTKEDLIEINKTMCSTGTSAKEATEALLQVKEKLNKEANND